MSAVETVPAVISMKRASWRFFLLADLGQRVVFREDSNYVGLQELPFEENAIGVHLRFIATVILLRRVSSTA